MDPLTVARVERVVRECMRRFDDVRTRGVDPLQPHGAQQIRCSHVGRAGESISCTRSLHGVRQLHQWFKDEGSGGYTGTDITPLRRQPAQASGSRSETISYAASSSDLSMRAECRDLPRTIERHSSGGTWFRIDASRLHAQSFCNVKAVSFRSMIKRDTQPTDERNHEVHAERVAQDDSITLVQLQNMPKMV